MKMSKLTRLSLYENGLSLESFEKLVRNCFLPAKTGRTASVKAEPISLEILVNRKALEDHEWSKSELILSARRDVSTVTRGDMSFTMHSFTWS
jgi:hypothetical protein